MKTIKDLSILLKNNEINEKTYVDTIMLTLNDSYVNNVIRFKNNLKYNKNCYINDNDEINEIIKKINNILNNKNVLIPNLPIFRFLDKTYSIGTKLSYDDLIDVLKNDKLIFLYNISTEDYISTGSLFYRCHIIDK